MGNATPKPPEPPEMDKDILEVYLGNTQPALGQMGFGGVMGYCSGLAFRKAGKLVGVVVGIGFIGAQLAASSGYVEVNWDKISKDAIKPWDTVSGMKKVVALEGQQLSFLTFL